MAIYLEDHLPVVKYEGLNSAKNGTLSGVLTLSGANVYSGAGTFSGVQTFSAAPSFSVAPTGASPVRTVTNSAAAGATVALTVAQCGQTFNNASTSGSPSWTLPTAANGLWYTFTVSNVTTGFTVTGGTIFAKANAAGASVTGTTLTNTQATAVVGDTITLVCDGTSWRVVAQSGIFAAA